MPSLSDYTSFYYSLLLSKRLPLPVPIILYVESDRHLTRIMENVFETAGYYVETCSDACRALGIMECRQHYNLLLLDNELHCFDGLELVRRARKMKHLTKTPIILISSEDCAEEARAAGASDFLRKQDSVVELLNTIRRLLDGQKATRRAGR